MALINPPPNIIDWLYEQIADDERRARGELANPLWLHARQHLVECQAKRLLIQAILSYESCIDGEWGCCHDSNEIRQGKCGSINLDKIEALRVMTMPYTSRPGYRHEWQPQK